MCAWVTTMRDTSRTSYPAVCSPASSAARPSPPASARHRPQSTRVTRSPSASAYTLTVSMRCRPTGSGIRVTPSSIAGSAVHPLAQREPHAQLDLVGDPGAVQRTGQVLHLEPGDAFQGQPGPVDRLADRVFDGVAGTRQLHRLLHRHGTQAGRGAPVPGGTLPLPGSPNAYGGVMTALDVLKDWPVDTAAVAVVDGSGVIASAGPPGSTVRHLLAHASGIAPDDDTVFSAPGRRRIYSNRGFELLADHVARRSGTPFAAHLQASVLDPLGMSGTRLAGTAA